MHEDRMTRWGWLCLALAVAACGAPSRAAHDDDDGGEEAFDPTTGTASGAGGSGLTGGAGGNGVGGATSGGGSSPVGLFPGAVVITEIMNNPAAVTDDQGEWFEIYNPTEQALSLQGAVIRHQPSDGAGHVISAPLLAPAGGYLVLARNGEPAQNGGVVVDYVYGLEVSLNNDSDHLAIETAEGELVDETSWDELSGLDPNGASRTLDRLVVNADDNDDDEHFCEASTLMAMSVDYATPGALNDPCP